MSILMAQVKAEPAKLKSSEGEPNRVGEETVRLQFLLLAAVRATNNDNRGALQHSCKHLYTSIYMMMMMMSSAFFTF